MVWGLIEKSSYETELINCLVGRKQILHRPGIEPGSQEWESCMIPLHQRRCLASRQLRADRCSLGDFEFKALLFPMVQAHSLKLLTSPASSVGRA